MLCQAIVGIIVESLTYDRIKALVALQKILEIGVLEKASCDAKSHLIMIDEILSICLLDRCPQGSNVS